MSTFLTVLVACCTVCRVSSAAAPLLFMLHYDNPEIPNSRPPAAISHSGLLFPGESSGDGGSGDRGEITSSGEAAPVSMIFPDGFNRARTPIEPTSECAHNLTVSYNGTSWKLLTQGNCSEGEWAVLVTECQPECRPRPCPVGQLEYQGRCVHPSDPTVCSEGQILYLNQRGSTFCDCEHNYLYDTRSGQCYARRERGRCDFGFILDINENGEADCMPNDCKSGDFERDPKSGKCFRKDFVGYCPVDSLDFYQNNLTVGCLELDIRVLFDRAIARSCSAGSRLTHLGRCREEIVLPSIISRPRSVASGCRDGSYGVSDEPCRRVNKYFE